MRVLIFQHPFFINDIIFLNFQKLNTLYFKKNTMNKNGPIIIIEDDDDGQELLKVFFNQPGYANELHFFAYGTRPWHI